jgi:hypothetical protein
MRARVLLEEAISAGEAPPQPRTQQSVDEVVFAGPVRTIPGNFPRVIAPTVDEPVLPIWSAASGVFPFCLRRQATPHLRITLVNGCQDLARINSIKETARVGDMFPGHVLHRTSNAGLLGWIRAHHVQPKRLGYRCRRNVKLSDVDGPAIGISAEQEGLPIRALNLDQLEGVFRTISTPLVRHHRHLRFTSTSQVSFLNNLQMMPNMPDYEITYRAGCHWMSYDVTARLTLGVGKIFE